MTNRKSAKDELLDEIEKKIRTTFIGAISSLEDSKYGALEGDNWDAEFDRVRTEILDKGNVQLRAIRKLIDNYQVAPARNHQYKLETKDPNRRKRGYNNG